MPSNSVSGSRVAITRNLASPTCSYSARDTPAALKAYRERMKLDGAWTLLHGDAANVQELAMLLGVKFKQDARGQFSHSNLITVLNPEGEIAHQRAGLMGDVSEAAKAVALVAAAR